MRQNRHELWAKNEKTFYAMPSPTSIFIKNCSIRFQKDFPASFIVWVTRQSTDFTLVYRVLVFTIKRFCFEAFGVVAEQCVLQL